MKRTMNTDLKNQNFPLLVKNVFTVTGLRTLPCGVTEMFNCFPLKTCSFTELPQEISLARSL